MGAWLRSSPGQLFLKGTGIGLLLGAGLLWILSLTGFLPSSWSVPLGALFVILATLIAYLQWGFPLSVRSEDQVYQILLRQFKSLPTMNNGTVVIRTSEEKGREIYATLCPPGEIERMQEEGSNDRVIILRISSLWGYVKTSAGNYTVKGKYVQVALFPSLHQGGYLFWTPRVSKREDQRRRDYFSYAIVSAGQVTELDWRYE